MIHFATFGKRMGENTNSTSEEQILKKEQRILNVT